MKTIKLFLLFVLMSASLFAQQLDVEGNGKIAGTLNINDVGATLTMSTNTDGISSILYFDRQSTNPITLAEGQLSYLHEYQGFAFTSSGIPASYNSANVYIDAGGSLVQDGGEYLRIGRGDAPHLSIDDFNVQARGVGGFTVDDLQLNAFGGDVHISDVGQTYKVGVGTFNPTEKLSVGGHIALSNLPNEQAIIKNGYEYDHVDDANIAFGNGSTPWMIGSGEGLDETSGIFGDGNAVTIWSPGDAYAVGGVPKSFLRIVDEDLWFDNDGNPYNNNALVGYYDENGMWQTSDRNMKENIESYAAGALDKITSLNAYKYSYKQSSEEVKKGAEPTVAVGVMAQELIQHIPEAVEVTQEGQHFVNHSMITPVLIEAIKEQQAIIDQLTARISALEGKSE